MNKMVWKVMGTICFAVLLIFGGVTFYRKHKKYIDNN